MTSNELHFIAIWPEIFVFAMTGITLMIGLFWSQWRSLPYFLVQATLIVAAGITVYAHRQLGMDDVFLFHHSFVFDSLAVTLKLFIYLFALIVFVYARHYNDERHILFNEFCALGLLATLGMMILVSGHNLLTLYLGIELLALPTYAMVALQRGKARCIEAAMKYFVMGALASGILLYGLSILFGITQSLDISKIAQSIFTDGQHNYLLSVLALAFILGGIAFKLGAAPLHSWVPDVYDGAPTSVTLFISTAPKLAVFALIMRLLVEGMPDLFAAWQQIIIFMAVVSIALGNLVAIVQTNIKRMLAYSSIAHLGYMLLGIACGTKSGNAASLFYIISYALMTLAAFGVVLLLSRTGVEANYIDDFAGLNSRHPWLAFMMLLVMFSLAGIPPLVGFIAKVGILEALISVHLVWLAVYAILFAIIGGYYYIRVIKVMYFQEPTRFEVITCPVDAMVMLTINSLAVFLLGVFPGALFTLCHSIFATFH